MAVSLTPKAAAHVMRHIAKRGKGIGLRFGVETSCCSGLAYKLEYVDVAGEDDTVFESNGVKIFVKNDALVYLDGTELDFVREGLNEGFKFNNPNVSETCGCGNSFKV